MRYIWERSVRSFVSFVLAMYYLDVDETRMHVYTDTRGWEDMTGPHGRVGGSLHLDCKDSDRQLSVIVTEYRSVHIVEKLVFSDAGVEVCCGVGAPPRQRPRTFSEG